MYHRLSIPLVIFRVFQVRCPTLISQCINTTKLIEDLSIVGVVLLDWVQLKLGTKKRDHALAVATQLKRQGIIQHVSNKETGEVKDTKEELYCFSSPSAIAPAGAAALRSVLSASSGAIALHHAHDHSNNTDATMVDASNHVKRSVMPVRGNSFSTLHKGTSLIDGHHISLSSLAEEAHHSSTADELTEEDYRIGELTTLIESLQERVDTLRRSKENKRAAALLRQAEAKARDDSKHRRHTPREGDHRRHTPREGQENERDTKKEEKPKDEEGQQSSSSRGDADHDQGGDDKQKEKSSHGKRTQQPQPQQQQQQQRPKEKTERSAESFRIPDRDKHPARETGGGGSGGGGSGSGNSAVAASMRDREKEKEKEKDKQPTKEGPPRDLHSIALTHKEREKYQPSERTRGSMVEPRRVSRTAEEALERMKRRRSDSSQGIIEKSLQEQRRVGSSDKAVTIPDIDGRSDSL